MFKVTTSAPQRRSLIQKLDLLHESIPALVVGFLSTATYPDGTRVAAVAAYNEYGTAKIPARPFMQTTVKMRKKKWAQWVAKKMKKGRMDADSTIKVMKQLGIIIQGDLQHTIRSYKFTPLAPSTVAGKGFEKTLIDTGTMLKSIDWELRDRE